MTTPAAHPDAPPQGAYAYEHSGRNPRTLATVGCIWVLIGAAWAWLDAAVLVVGLVAFATVPAVYDYASGRRSGVRIAPDTLSWYSGRRTGEAVLEAIDHIRLDTRLDFSVRASAVLSTGRKIRLPLEAIPPADIFQEALSARGIKVQRHHFSLLG